MKTFLFNWPTLDHEFQPASSMHAKITYLIMDTIHTCTNPKINGVCTYVYLCKQKKNLKGDTRAEGTAEQNEKKNRAGGMSQCHSWRLHRVYFPVKILVLQPGFSSTFRLVVIGVSSQR